MTLTKFGEEFLVNTTTIGRQFQPQVEALAGGGFVVVWTDESNGPGDVRGQVFSATGAKLGAEFIVNTTLPGGHSQARVAALEGGGFAVAWLDESGLDANFDSVKAQAFTADGTKVGGEIRFSAGPVFDENQHFITAAADGGFILGARVNDGEAAVPDFQDREFFTQRYSESGVLVAGRIQFTENAGSEIELRSPVGATLSDDRSVVMFFRKPFGASDSLRFQFLDGSGSPTGEATSIDGTGPEILTPLAIEGLPDGGFIALYSRTPAAGSQFFDSIVFQRFGAGGGPVGDEVLVEEVRNAAIETRETISASVTVLPDGRFVIVSERGDSADTAQPIQPVARLYSTDGVQIGEPVIVSAVGGGFFFKNAPVATALADGRVAIAFVDGDLINATGDTSFPAIRAQFLNVGTDPFTPLNLVGTLGADSLVGGMGDDTIAGDGGNDTLDGGDGDDRISSSDGNDLALGGLGNDNIGGGLGNDTIDGGDGDDIIGGGFGADSILGGAGADVVAGGADNDTLSGGDGNDSMSGSFGNDLIDGGDGADDIGGGTGRDTIDAGAGDDRVGGGEGDDSIDGGDGNDFLAGGGRDDIIDGGAGNDTINAGAGNDKITGGTGADQFVFASFFEGEADIVTDFEDGIDSFFIRRNDPDTGEPNITNGGNGLAGFLAAMNIIDTDAGAQMTVNGNTILVEGITAAQLTLDDFTFL